MIAGRMVFAAAAEALGGVYGTTAMERALAFSPRARAERRSIQSGSEPQATKRSLPTGTCKKWLEGHVPIDQTLALIAELHPNVANRMKQVRDGDIVKALTVSKDGLRFVGSRLAALSPELFGKYLGCMALGHRNPNFISGLSAGLLHLAMAGRGPEVLVACLGLDRQIPFPRGPAANRSLDEAFDLSLRKVAETQPEMAFAKVALAELWLRRKAEQERITISRAAKVRGPTAQTAYVRDHLTLVLRWNRMFC
ncbi:hypothetical protein [Pseudoxanthomonas suwonensis]|uniref:hypothetical protein n=1 Tax=Pseudoxanthomonas suwonensis TaxID=314722 RepID=UPI0011849A33|nr:hypothetical protein [Pseudoxanthomonas suwonensis]